jgi:peptidoglycan/xylan/chitin deacetylase (PgdA/CDA1 family)
MAFIRKHYTPVSMHDVLAYYDQQQPLPRRALLVTVDDGYCDFAEHIWPIAKEEGIPLTLFVATGYPDNPQHHLWWDQLYHAITTTTCRQAKTPVGNLTFTTTSERVAAFKRLRRYVKSLSHHEAIAWVRAFSEQLGVSSLPDNEILDWNALRALARDGVTLAPHTCTHPMLNRLSLDEVSNEIIKSRDDLERAIDEVLPVFAYPSGGVTDEVVDRVEAAGIRLAFTTQRGVNNLEKQHHLRMKRINVGASTTIPILRAQCLPSVADIN